MGYIWREYGSYMGYRGRKEGEERGKTLILLIIRIKKTSLKLYQAVFAMTMDWRYRRMNWSDSAAFVAF
jgi:hypothetical protein